MNLRYLIIYSGSIRPGINIKMTWFGPQQKRHGKWSQDPLSKIDITNTSYYNRSQEDVQTVAWRLEQLVFTGNWLVSYIRDHFSKQNCFTFHFDNKVVLNHTYFFISIAGTCLIYPVVCVDDTYPDVFHSYCRMSMLSTWYLFACNYLVRSNCDTWAGTGIFSEWACAILFWVVGFIAVWTVFSCSLCGHVIFLLDIIMCFKSMHCHISILSFHITYSYTLNLAKFHYSALVVHHHQKCQQFTVTTSNLFFWQINITSSSRKGFESRCM